MPFTQQKELEMQRSLLKRAEKMAGIGHWHVNLVENNIFWSDEIYRIHGLDKDKFVPTLREAIEFFHPDDREAVKDYMTEAVDEKMEFFFELRLIQPSGNIRLVQSFGQPELDEDGIVTGIFGIFRDITEKRQRELEREEQQKFMELVLESIPDPVFVKDSHFRIILANKAFLELYPEDKRDQIIDTTTIEDYSPEDAEAFLAEDKKALEHGYTETYETIAFPNGTKRTFFTKKVAFNNAENEPNILAMARDVSELHKAQEELKRSNQDLQDFAFTVSHDLKSPLRHISMSANLVKDGIKENLDETQQEFLKIMTDGAEKAQVMIDTLLEYSRIGQTKVEFEEVDLNITVNNVLSMLALEIEEMNADVVVKKMPVLKKANEGLLMRMFQNLVENALKYQKQGQTPKVLIYAEEHGDTVNIHVEDNGIGIAPEFADKIFIIFQRLHGEDSEYKGIGLGLAVCQKIARAHNGNIKLDTDYQEGAGFIVSLPNE